MTHNLSITLYKLYNYISVTTKTQSCIHYLEGFFYQKKKKIIMLLVLWLKSSENKKCFEVLPVESIADAGVSYTLTAALLMEPAVAGSPHRLTRLLTFPQGVTLWHEGHRTVKVGPIRVLGHFLSLVCKRNKKLCFSPFMF